MLFFTRRHTYYFQVPKEELKRRLMGAHVQIHQLDFEVMERDYKLTIIPHAEQEEAIKTLPITSVEFDEKDGKTKVMVTSKMRRLDTGGPMLIMIFCLFMLIAAAVLFKMDSERTVAATLFCISLSIFTVFVIRLETGYFDYVRKVREYIRDKANPVAKKNDLPLMQA
mgnify:CR=1 FL=1